MKISMTKYFEDNEEIIRVRERAQYFYIIKDGEVAFEDPDEPLRIHNNILKSDVAPEASALKGLKLPLKEGDAGTIFELVT